MRKSLLLIAAGLVALGANAKDVHRTGAGKATNLHKDHQADVHVTAVRGNHSQAKGTVAPFITEPFTSGLPSGWTVGSTTGNGTWKWFPQGQQSGSAFHIEAIATTTGGFMIYDSDSIGTASPTVNPVGWMASGPLNCSGHSTVALRFNEYFRSFNDSCFVDVANNAGFSGATRYAVSPNNSLNGNDYVPSNPYNVFINITSAAANQSTVYVRFYYYGPVDGGYSWQVDDMTLSELDPVNVGLHGSFLFGDYGAYGTSIGNVPLTFADSVAPVTLLDNMGSTAQSGFTVTAKIFRNNTQVYTNTQTVAALPVSALDSIIQFPNFKPTQTGDYFLAMSQTVTGNANTNQLVDTVHFSVTDTIWSQNQGLTNGGFYIHKPASQGELSGYIGTRFDISAAAGATDTLTGISVAFDAATSVGAPVQVQIYKLDTSGASAGWSPFYSTFVRTLTAPEISTATELRYAYLPMQLDANYPVLSEGTWAAVVTTVNASASSAAVILATGPNPATTYAGFFGQSDTAYNDGSFQFGFQTQATGITSIPLVRMHFATNNAVVSTKNVVSNVSLGQVYPNPANNSVNITFTLAEDANVNVNLMNTVGQVLKSQSMGKLNAGSAKTVTFSTADMPAGVYYYSVDVNGVRTTNRFVVSH